ncbi:hypothetical protein [Sphingobium yanoikuyae]|uniref:Uncharacterized protein n=1 Tax=Sphingobium yanoikuyae TaxID=13690 RepID=A0A6M4GBW0_SPHYA|nr:hypothetical protein [Sphingobium yanoikuyae]QJR04538.1 hypothetical protein HH800_21460 [Sphingobium yanoikuyae]
MIINQSVAKDASFVCSSVWSQADRAHQDCRTPMHKAIRREVIGMDQTGSSTSALEIPSMTNGAPPFLRIEGGTGIGRQRAGMTPSITMR